MDNRAEEELLYSPLPSPIASYPSLSRYSISNSNGHRHYSPNTIGLPLYPPYTNTMIIRTRREHLLVLGVPRDTVDASFAVAWENFEEGAAVAVPDIDFSVYANEQSCWLV
jgi:hypothetical protein